MHGQTHFYLFPNGEEEKERMTEILRHHQPSATLEDAGSFCRYRTYYPINREQLEYDLDVPVAVRRHLADITNGQPVGGACYNPPQE